MSNQNAEQTELIALNQRIGVAEKSRDAVFMSEVIHESLVFRRANGTIVGKAAYLEGLSNPTNTYSKLEVSEVDAQVFETLAQVSLIVNAEGMRGETPFSGKFRNLRIFMKDTTAPHGWLCHMWFNAKID
jgi:hypothetical protein